MGRGQRLLWDARAAFDDRHALFTEPLRLTFDASREFRIQRSVVLHDAPVGGDSLLAGLGVFFRRFGGDADEDARDEGAGGRRAVAGSQVAADLADGADGAFADGADFVLDVDGRRDEERARAETLLHFLGDVDDLGEVRVVHLFAPGFAGAHG
jgi:hypothetical protein